MINFDFNFIFQVINVLACILIFYFLFVVLPKKIKNRTNQLDRIESILNDLMKNKK